MSISIGIVQVARYTPNDARALLRKYTRRRSHVHISITTCRRQIGSFLIVTSDAGQKQGLTPQDADDIQRRYFSGERLPTIAASYGVSTQAVQQYLSRRGVTAQDQRRALDDRVAELAGQGKTVPAIAHEVGRTPPTVRTTLTRLGIQPRWDPPKRRRSPTDKTEEILRLRAEGSTIEAIAKAVGRATSTVSKCLIRNGQRTQEFRPKPKRHSCEVVKVEP